MIAAALDVEGGKVKPACSGRAEQEVSDAVDKLPVDLARLVGGEVLQQRIDAGLLKLRRIEEGLIEWNFRCNGVAIVVEELDVGPKHRVADAISGGREFRGNPGIYARFVPFVPRDRLCP